MSASQLLQFEGVWKDEIEKGNGFFQSLAFPKAYSHYMEAMMVCEVLMENITSVQQPSLRIPGMYFITCINLANNYFGMQDNENAASYFLYGTYKMKQLSDEPGIPSLVKQAASIYWLKGVQLYTEFSKKSGMPIPVDLSNEETYFQLQKMKQLFALGKENMN
jgi:hypothetical protein